jgi:cell division protein FtsI/penicillin-binding protein 2
MGERKVTSTVTGFLTAGSTSKNATITVALKNGVVTADLKVPAVAGLAFDTS